VDGSVVVVDGSVVVVDGSVVVVDGSVVVKGSVGEPVVGSEVDTSVLNVVSVVGVLGSLGEEELLSIAVELESVSGSTISSRPQAPSAAARASNVTPRRRPTNAE